MPGWTDGEMINVRRLTTRLYRNKTNIEQIYKALNLGTKKCALPLMKRRIEQELRRRNFRLASWRPTEDDLKLPQEQLDKLPAYKIGEVLDMLRDLPDKIGE